MGIDLGKLELILAAVDNLSPVIRAASAAAQSASSVMAGAFKSAGDSSVSASATIRKQLSDTLQTIKDLEQATRDYGLTNNNVTSTSIAGMLADARAQAASLTAALAETAQATQAVGAAAATAQPQLDAMAAGMSKAGQTSADSIKMIAGMSQAGREAAGGFEDVTAAGNGFGSMVGAITERLLIYASVRGVISAIQSTVQFGLELERLSAQTGFSVQAVQALNYEAAATGVPLNSVTNAISQLQRKLELEDGGAVKGIEHLGLNFQAIRAMAPEQQFDVVATALSQVKDQSEFAGLAAELFSSRSGTAIAALIKGYQDLNKEAQDSGAILSSSEVSALADIGKAWDTTKLKAEAYFARVLLWGQSNALPGVPSSALGLPSDKDTVDAQLAYFAKFPQVPKPDTGTASAQSYLASLNAQIKASAIQTPTFGDDKQGAAALADAERIAKDLTRSAEDQIAAEKKAAAAAAEHAKNLEDYTNASKSYDDILNLIGNDLYEGVAADLARGVSTKALVDIYKTTPTVIEDVKASEKSWNDGLGDTLKAMSDNEQETAKFQDGLRKLLVGYNDTGKVVIGFTGILHTVDPALIQNAESLEKMQQRLAETAAAFKQYFGAFAGVSLAPLPGVQPSGLVQDAFIEKARKDTVSFGQELGSLATEFDKVGKASGGAFGNVLHDISLALTATQALDKAMKLSGLGPIDPGASPVNGAGSAAGGLAAAGGGAAVATATASALTIVGAWVAVGVAVFAFVSALREANDESEKLYKITTAVATATAEFKVPTPFSQQLGSAISDTEQLFAGIAKLNTATTGLSHDQLLAAAHDAGISVLGPTRALLSDAEIAEKLNVQANRTYLDAMAQAAHLPDIIKELGGVGNLTADELTTVKDRAKDLFTLIDLGGSTGAAAIKSLDDTLVDFTQNLDPNGRVSDFFTEMVAQARAAGIVLPQVADFFKTQAANAATGLSDLLTEPLIASAATIGKAVTDAQTALDSLKDSGTATASALAAAQDTLTAALTAQHSEAERNKQALDDLGQTAFTAFNAAIASGENFVQALTGIAPQLSTITQAYKDLGLSIDDASLKGILLENTILNGPGGVGKAISGLNALITAGMNFGPGVETPDAIAAQQRTLASVYTQTQAATQAAGGTTVDALLPFQQSLHELLDYANKNNIALDDKTQQMINQSKELGIWTDDFETDSQKTRDSIADLINSNEHLAAVLGGAPYVPSGIPGSTGTPSSVPPGLIPPGGIETDPTAPSPIYDPVPEAAGGVGFASGPMTFSTQGNEEFAFSGEGQRFARAPQSGGSQAGSKTYNVTVNAKDPAVEEQWIRDWMRREGVDITVEEIKTGRHTRDIQSALNRVTA